jgi:multidrug efflux pump subunit AcrA (membrane-fusion protein)
LAAKHRELQEAFLATEATKNNLQAALKKVKVIRITATAFTILLFLVVGLFLWNKKPLSGKRSPASRSDESAPAPVTTFKVALQPVISTISLTGKLQPLQMINITSPLSGKIQRVNFHYGDVVTAGQTLMTMDVSEAQIKYREAEAAFIKAAENFRQVENWNKGTDVVRSRRSLTKAKLSLDNQKKTLDETERLFNKGIVPASEYESAKQQYAGQLLDFQSAEEEVKAAVAKGNPEYVKIARFEMENARSRLKQTEKELTNAVVVAPVSGIAMKPSAGKGKDGKMAEPGASFQNGELLLAIGDLTGFSVDCKVDEVNVTRVRQGQKVLITGDAFQGLQMSGAISAISPNAEEGESRGVPSFAVTVAINAVTPEQKKRIFVGMSANLEIVIYEKPDAVMIPVSAVLNEGGKRYVMKTPGNGQNLPAEKVAVETGHTTLDSVEITKGLKTGDLIEVRSTPYPASDKGTTEKKR